MGLILEAVLRSSGQAHCSHIRGSHKAPCRTPTRGRGHSGTGICSPGAPRGQCPDQMEMAGPPPATKCACQELHPEGPTLELPRAQGDWSKACPCGALSLSPKHTLLSFLVKSKCPQCPLKPSGASAPSLCGSPLQGSCVQRVSK